MSMKTSFGIYQKQLDELFDRPTTRSQPQPVDGRFLFVVFSHRSGSNLMASSLADNGVAPKAMAPFSVRVLETIAPKVATFDDACQHIAKASTGGKPYLAMKVGWRALLHLASEGNLGSIFSAEQTRVLWIDRADKLRQSVSYVKASQSGRWYDLSVPMLNPYGEEPDYEFDGRRLLRREHKFSMASQITAKTLDALALPIHRVLYEDFIADHDAVMADIARFLDLPPAPPVEQTLFTKQSSKLNDKWYNKATKFKQKPPGQKLLERLEQAGAEDLDYFDRVIADIKAPRS